MRHFDVQIMGAKCCSRPHRRDEDREGKTLVATLPSTSRSGKTRRPRLTVNDYLARRDAE